MKKLLGALALVMFSATVGCLSGPHVVKGGGESVVPEQLNGRYTGNIKVSGHVVNSGGSKAQDVILTFKFFQDGTSYLEGKLRVGDISAGSTAEFSGTFFGPPVKGVFTWEYRIEWD